eukprot:COSAG02_NODE_6431_length_3572_cov_6.762165_3_plen_152_part_00
MKPKFCVVQCWTGGALTRQTHFARPSELLHRTLLMALLTAVSQSSRRTCREREGSDCYTRLVTQGVAKDRVAEFCFSVSHQNWRKCLRMDGHNDMFVHNGIVAKPAMHHWGFTTMPLDHPTSLTDETRGRRGSQDRRKCSACRWDSQWRSR